MREKRERWKCRDVKWKQKERRGEGRGESTSGSVFGGILAKSPPERSLNSILSAGLSLASPNISLNQTRNTITYPKPMLQLCNLIPTVTKQLTIKPACTL